MEADPSEMNRRLSKLYHRRGTAHAKLNLLEEALRDFSQALKYRATSRTCYHEV